MGFDFAYGAKLMKITRILGQKYYFSGVKKTRHILYPLLVAWLIIFAHDTIPHEHHHGFSCHTHQHATSCGDEEGGVFQYNPAADHPACHFSVDILPGLSLDDDFIAPERVRYIAPEIMKVPLRAFTIHINRNPLFLSQNQLRAPPAA
jgi:hypothetical protein